MGDASIVKVNDEKQEALLEEREKSISAECKNNLLVMGSATSAKNLNSSLHLTSPLPHELHPEQFFGLSYKPDLIPIVSKPRTVGQKTRPNYTSLTQKR